MTYFALVFAAIVLVFLAALVGPTIAKALQKSRHARLRFLGAAIMQIVTSPLALLMGADILSGLGYRKLCATTMGAGTFYYFVTLHGTGGSALTSSTDVYAATGLGELATGNGYTAGGKTAGTVTVTTTNLDTPDVVWTAAGGNIGPASYAAVWCNTSNSITGAKFVCTKDMSASPQTASDGNPITVSVANLVGF
jgi:hypothetical protein